MTDYDSDLLIVGGGPGGLATALHSRSLGLSVIVAEPRERKYHPQSVVDAQFSMPFGAAVAAISL